MSAQPAEDFVREGRTLVDWLRDLICSDGTRREHAALMIMSMHLGVRDPHAEITSEMLPADADAHRAAFGRAVRSALEAPELPRKTYVMQLMQFIEESRRRQIEEIKADNARMGEFMDKTLSEGEGQPDAVAKMSDEMDQRLSRPVENAPIWAVVVFRQLDGALEEHQDRLALWLDERGMEQDAHEAIRRAKPAARKTIVPLLRGLDALADKKAWWWDGIETLSAAARGDTATIKALGERLDGEPAVAGNAAAVLGEMGQDAVEAIPNLIERMLRLSRDTEEFVRLAAIVALGDLGVGRTEVTERLVEAVVEGENYEPGYAIDRFAPTTVPAARAVPLLIQQFATFEEFDPDRTYKGEHARVAEALSRYGVAAAPAVPTLMKHIEGEDGINESVVCCLGAIGPAAVAAAAVLTGVASRAGIKDLCDDPSYVGETWRAITEAGEP